MKRTEFRKFNSHYHDLAERAIASEHEKAEAEKLRYRYLGFRQHYLENFLCRTHDFMVQYLEDILFEALITLENLVLEKDWSRFENEIGTTNGSPEQVYNLVALIVERLASPLNVGELCRFLRKRTGVEVTPESDEKAFVLILAAMRNLIVHNDGTLNERFMQKISGLPFKFELLPGNRVQIDEQWLVNGAQTIDRIVFRHDHAMSKLGVSSRDRRTIFWMR